VGGDIAWPAQPPALIAPGPVLFVLRPFDASAPTHHPPPHLPTSLPPFPPLLNPIISRTLPRFPPPSAHVTTPTHRYCCMSRRALVESAKSAQERAAALLQPSSPHDGSLPLRARTRVHKTASGWGVGVGVQMTASGWAVCLRSTASCRRGRGGDLMRRASPAGLHAPDSSHGPQDGDVKRFVSDGAHGAWPPSALASELGSAVPQDEPGQQEHEQAREVRCGASAVTGLWVGGNVGEFERAGDTRIS